MQVRFVESIADAHRVHLHSTVPPHSIAGLTRIFPSRPAVKDQGLALGLCTVPLVVASLSGDSRYLTLALAQAGGQLLGLAVQAGSDAPRPDDAKPSARSEHTRTVIGLASAVLAGCGLRYPPLTAVAGLAGSGLLWACGLYLPRTLSLGEASLVTQVRGPVWGLEE